MSSPGAPRRTPLFRLLESYVLDAIGELEPADEAVTARTVRAVFQSKQPWREVLSEQFGFTEVLRDQLVTLWTEGQEAARAQGTELKPGAFATMVVDENFSDALEMLATEIVDSPKD